MAPVPLAWTAHHGPPPDQDLHAHRRRRHHRAGRRLARGQEQRASRSARCGGRAQQLPRRAAGRAAGRGPARSCSPRSSTICSTSAASSPSRAIPQSGRNRSPAWNRRWTTTTRRWSRSRSSSCPAAAAPAPCATWRARYAGAPSARSSALHPAQTVSPYSQQYLNRLSDLLFVLSRVLNRRDGRGDVLWRRGRG